MALGDVGMFSPAESQYGTPGAFDKMLQAEAQKRAAYLSSMDQFYENLAESQRQFDETLGFKTETRDLELDWAQEKFEKEQILDREVLEANKAHDARLLDLKEREIGGKYEDDLTPFQSFKLFNLAEDEAESKRDVRDVYTDDVSGDRPFGYGPSTPTFGKDYVNPYSAPESGSVYPGSGSALDITGGRRQKDNPNWVPPEFDNMDVDEYDYP